MIRTLSLLMFLVACGGKPQATTTPRSHDEHAEMASMGPALAKFHDRLAPLWHANGSDRMNNACLATTELAADAHAVSKAGPPARANAAAWAEGVTSLLNAVRGLELACSDGTGLDPAFAEVHEAFHGLLEASGGEHEGPEKPGY